MMAAMRRHARPSPAAPRPSSVTTLFVCHVCGPAMEMSTALMAPTSGPATAVHRDPKLLLLISARPWSSVVAAESVFMAAGDVMEDLIVSIDRMKLLVVRTIYNILCILLQTPCFYFNTLYPFCSLSTSHLPP